jgi:hypothetical protein
MGSGRERFGRFGRFERFGRFGRFGRFERFGRFDRFLQPEFIQLSFVYKKRFRCSIT